MTQCVPYKHMCNGVEFTTVQDVCTLCGAVNPYQELPEDISTRGKSIAQVLTERGNNYGSFDGHAKITQALKVAMQNSRNWEELPDDMKETLEMVAHKIGRILNGNPKYKDSWTDIIGYVTLIEKDL